MSPKLELQLVNGLQRALDRQQLHMVYQPKISVRDGSLRQVEALVRWEDPELGTVKPSHFVPLAEEHGLIHELTQWGLRVILKQWLDWRQEGVDTCIAFNISALSLQHLDFPDLVERMCRALGVPTDRLVLELTEGATQPLVKLMDALTRFRIKGIGLAIDDFGTGYSSLMQLRQLPFTEVKIDQAFVADAPHSRDSPADHSGRHGSRPCPRAHCDSRRSRNHRSIADRERARLRLGPGLSHRGANRAKRAKGMGPEIPACLAGDDRGREASPVGRRRSRSRRRMADLRLVPSRLRLVRNSSPARRWL